VPRGAHDTVKLLSTVAVTGRVGASPAASARCCGGARRCCGQVTAFSNSAQLRGQTRPDQFELFPNGVDRVTNAVPWTWAASDRIIGKLECEAA